MTRRARSRRSGAGKSWLAQQRFPSQGALARLAAYRARLWLAQGDVAAAATWARESVVEDDGELAYFQALTLVRHHLNQARLRPDGPSIRDALTTLGRLLTSAEAIGWKGHLIEILILQALARQIEGNQVLAVLALGQALALAAPEGYVRVFLDEGAPVMALLARWVAERGEPQSRRSGTGGRRTRAALRWSPHWHRNRPRLHSSAPPPRCPGRSPSR